jgi:ketosteroid isomerase-like protein
MHQNQLTQEQKETIYTDLDNINLKWKTTFSSNPKALKDYYHPQAIIFYEKETHKIGDEHIINTYLRMNNNQKTIDNLSVSYRAVLNGNQDIVYESGHFLLSTKEIYQYMVIWSKKDSIWYRELEVLARYNPQESNEDPLKPFRDQWGILASNQGCKALIENLYTKDCVYYNQGNVYTGHEQLNQMYSYMNQPEYTVHLKKDFSVVVSTSLAYEIGTWIIPNYQDKYFVIWIKDCDGLWKMKLDSNW